MKKLLALSLMLLLFTKMNAQQVIACYKYTEKGEAVEPNTVWNVSSAGGNLYLLLNNNGKLPSRRLTVNIDKLKDGQYKSYEIKSIIGDTNKTWAVLDYFFKEEGQYRVSFLDSSYKTLAAGEVLIKKAAETVIKGDAFKDSKIVFCANIDQRGNPSGINNLFTIGRNGGVIKIKITNPYVFNTSKFFLDVYKKTRHGDYELYESRNYPIYAENATWIYFSYVFNETGEYKLAIYTKDNRYINTGFITIAQKP